MLRLIILKATLEDQRNVSVMEIVAATLPWHVLGLQMVPSGHAKNGAGDKVGLQQLSAVAARTAKPQSLQCARTVPCIHRQSPTTCRELHLSARLCLLLADNMHTTRPPSCQPACGMVMKNGLRWWVPQHTKRLEP